MRPADFDIHKVIEGLQGTTDSISDHLPDGMEEEDLTSDDYNAIDNEIFLCAECGWWCEISEASESDGGEEVCLDCRVPEDD